MIGFILQRLMQAAFVVVGRVECAVASSRGCLASVIVGNCSDFTSRSKSNSAYPPSFLFLFIISISISISECFDGRSVRVQV